MDDVPHGVSHADPHDQAIADRVRVPRWREQVWVLEDGTVVTLLYPEDD